ncbi:protein phosphatase 1 regulatory subunit 3B-like [Ptychodera flava]|uniref:protein phosphatase 1 regulatory subunit 3B-like n=1 Tax=Ptychodera flava TaxID=63121 RepID=UPI00396A9DB3
MPVDCSLFLLSSSPPTHNYYLKNPYDFTGFKLRLNDVAQRPVTLRSCLNAEFEKRSNNIMNSSISESTEASPVSTTEVKAKTKKKVSFADSKGLSLTSVRIMQEPSDMPPALNIQAIGDLIRDETPQPSSTTNYILDFEQPASNYLDFRDRLEKNNVSLENVIMKDSHTIMGTVKVRNIAFEKYVKVRVTHDSWASYKDVLAVYSPPSYAFGLMGSATPEKYDTFSFEFQIPLNCNAKKIEFCVCYDVGGQSYWDNNCGKNYNIVSEQWKTVSQQEQLRDDYRSLRANSNYEWSGFSYWKTTANESDSPYW